LRRPALLALACVLTLSAVLALGLTGCAGAGLGSGGGDDKGGPTDPGATPPPGMGGLSFVIAWPQPEASAKLIPTGTDHITFEVYHPGVTTPEVSLTVRQTDVVSGRVVRQVFVRSSDRKSITVTAWDTDQQIVSQATQVANVREGQLTHLAMTLQPTGITAPVVTGTATPAVNLLGSNVALSGTATSPHGSIVHYQWDFEADGVFDYSSATTPDTTTTKAAAGEYTAIFRATDNDGLYTDTDVPYSFAAPYAPSWGSIPATIGATVGAASEPVTLPYTIGLPARTCTLTVSPATVTWTQTEATDTGFTGTFRATDPTFVGTIDVTLTLTDTDARTATATTQLVVEQPREWTWIVYVAAANNLEDFAYDDVNEMEQAEVPAGVQIVALVDTTPSDGTHSEWDGSGFRYVIQHDSDPLRVTSPSTDLGQVDSGDWNTLKGFVDWAVANYPANRYGVILWDHGAGFKSPSSARPPLKGICWDDDTGSHIATAEMPPALAGLPNGKANVFQMDACLMGMAEVAYEMRDAASYCIGSEENVPGQGNDYSDLFARLGADSTQPDEKLAVDFVDSYAAYYGPNGWGDETMAAVDCSKIAGVAEAADDFATLALASWTGQTPGQWSQVLGQVTSFGDPEFRDMHHLGSLALATLTDSALANSAAQFRWAVNAAVVSYWAGAGYPDSRGLSIWVPESGSSYYMSTYNTLAWAHDTKWDEFLTMAAP
jgi:hypothetical protein